ncbi:hypothetical protein GUJ93_ZPchr0012g18954 [Zizania palustris]|uniref:Uncharacterized protein n=1 Tax=Zizania palustris TaxID=103762 RepID=A0A8J5WN47_ZIZPA|nr:hypothetical protein GUJ93_ZPchr0012g18954 [Zizania palustris]
MVFLHVSFFPFLSFFFSLFFSFFFFLSHFSLGPLLLSSPSLAAPSLLAPPQRRRLQSHLAVPVPVPVASIFLSVELYHLNPLTTGTSSTTPPVHRNTIPNLHRPGAPMLSTVNS